VGERDGDVDNEEKGVSGHRCIGLDTERGPSRQFFILRDAVVSYFVLHGHKYAEANACFMGETMKHAGRDEGYPLCTQNIMLLSTNITVAYDHGPCTTCILAVSSRMLLSLIHDGIQVLCSDTYLGWDCRLPRPAARSRDHIPPLHLVHLLLHSSLTPLFPSPLLSLILHLYIVCLSLYLLHLEVSLIY
jgi:hypothetical protein